MGGPPPYFLTKNFFEDRPPPYLRVWMTGAPPYLKVSESAVALRENTQHAQDIAILISALLAKVPLEFL